LKNVNIDEFVEAATPCIMRDRFGGDITNEEIDNYLKIKELAPKTKQYLEACRKGKSK
jgi:hypothetical protein